MRTLETSTVIAQGPEFTQVVVMPWLQALTGQRHRFTTPPMIHRDNGLMIVLCTRWSAPGAAPEIQYEAASDQDGLIPVIVPATDEDWPGRLWVWAPCPVPVPLGLELLSTQALELPHDGT